MTHRPFRSCVGASLLTLAVLHGCTATQVRYQDVGPGGPEAATADATLYLVGDGGEANEHRDAVLRHLAEEIDRLVALEPTRPVVVAFLGDNIYEVGARPSHEAEDAAHLRAQTEALGHHPHVRGVFVPGNHDWSKGGSDGAGRAAVRVQQEWLERLDRANRIQLLPSDACPGPSTLDPTPSLHLIFIDTEWLLREPDDGCGTSDDFYLRLHDDLARHREDRVVLLSHHPMASGGPHGGNVAPLEQGPFVYYLAVKSGVSIQDIASRRYSEMIRRLEEAIAASGASPLAHGAGHDHSLQVVRMEGRGRPRYQLVSGAGSKSNNARRIDGMRYATNGYGYMRLDFHESGADLVVYAKPRDGGIVRPVFSCSLEEDDGGSGCPEAPLAEDGR